MRASDLLRAVAGRPSSTFLSTSPRRRFIIPDVFVTEPEEDGAGSFCAFRAEPPSPPTPDFVALDKALKFLQQPANTPVFRRLQGEDLDTAVVMPRRSSASPPPLFVDPEEDAEPFPRFGIFMPPLQRAAPSPPVHESQQAQSATDPGKRTLKRRATKAFRTLAKTGKNFRKKQDSCRGGRETVPTYIDNADEVFSRAGTIDTPNKPNLKRRPLSQLFQFGQNGHHEAGPSPPPAAVATPPMDGSASPNSVWSTPPRPANPIPPSSPPSLPPTIYSNLTPTHISSSSSSLEHLPIKGSPNFEAGADGTKKTSRMRSRRFSFRDLHRHFKPSRPDNSDFMFEAPAMADQVRKTEEADGSEMLITPLSLGTTQVKLGSLHFDRLQFDPAAF